MSHGEFWNAASALATIAGSLITALTLLFLVIQVRETRRYTLGEFVNGLGKEFAEFDEVFEVLLLHREGPTPELHQAELPRCLRFFERVKTLCDVGVLDAKVLDGMFGSILLVSQRRLGSGKSALRRGAFLSGDLCPSPAVVRLPKTIRLRGSCGRERFSLERSRTVRKKPAPLPSKTFSDLKGRISMH
jgi:hypothetical protein